MTIAQLTAKLTALKPHAYSAAEVLAWINSIEERIFAEVIQTHANDDEITFTAYTSQTVDTTALLAPDPYSELYTYYLMTQVDLYNMELEKYNNSAALFNRAWYDFCAFWNRNFLPVQSITHFTL